MKKGRMTALNVYTLKSNHKLGASVITSFFSSSLVVVYLVVHYKKFCLLF